MTEPRTENDFQKTAKSETQKDECALRRALPPFSGTARSDVGIVGETIVGDLEYGDR